MFFLCRTKITLSIAGQNQSKLYIYDSKKYRVAASKEEQCEIEIKWFNPKHNATKSEIEEIEDYHKFCPKSKSNNIISCPKKIIKKKKDLKLKWLNDYFKKIAKKSKKKKKAKKWKSKKTKKSKVKKYKSKKKKKKTKSKNRKKRKRSKRDKNV